MSPESIVKYLERTLDTQLVAEFHSSGSEWKGEEKHFSLFYFWKNHVDMVHALRTPVNEIVLNLDDVQLIDGDNFDLLIDSLILEEDYTEEGTTINVITSEVATLSNVNCATVTPETENPLHDNNEPGDISPDFDEVNQLQLMQTEEDNENCITVSPITDNLLHDNNDSSDILDGIDKQLMQAEDVSSYETGSTSTPGNTGNSNEMIHTEENHNPNHLPQSEPLHIPSGISKPFQDTLFWPEPSKKNSSKSSKSKKEKENLPSVLSSPEFINYLKRKQKEKEDFENGKAERKRIRIENKQRREAEKEEKKIVIECKKAERKRKLDELNAEKEEKKKVTENMKAERKRKLDELSAKKVERKIAKQTPRKT